MEVGHFLNKWNLKCNKDKLGATTDKMSIVGAMEMWRTLSVVVTSCVFTVRCVNAKC